MEYRPVKHGTDCVKQKHLGGGYLHAENDDTPYDVDGLAYCGRCHEYLGAIIRLAARPRPPTCCGYCDYDEADGQLIEQCAKCKAVDKVSVGTRP